MHYQFEGFHVIMKVAYGQHLTTQGDVTTALRQQVGFIQALKLSQPFGITQINSFSCLPL